MTRPHLPSGLVLSGGGMRGAYEVGVVRGLVEALGLTRDSPAPFAIFAGTSVGAINAAYFAANAERGDLDVDGLCAVWRRLRLETHLRIDPIGLLAARKQTAEGSNNLGRSLLNARPLEVLIGRAIRWKKLRRNIDAGHARALLVAALDVATGRTTIFTDMAPDAQFRPSLDPRRVAVQEHITGEHILASAAIPMMFPARRVGSSFYCDGGLRFNTPIAPAIRAGAERLVVITLHGAAERAKPVQLDVYPSLAFLAGKVLNALLLDPVVYDLQVLERLNQLVGILEETVPAESMANIDRVLTKVRGAPYRRLDTLIFTPSQDIGELAAKHITDHLASYEVTRLARWLLKTSARGGADWAAYLLFDGRFAKQLIELGRRDALARREEIVSFFSNDRRTDSPHRV